MSRHDDVNKRMAHSNPQEDHFIYYLNWQKISYHHIGFQNRYTEDEWKKLNPALKKIPDFMALIDGIPKFYEVKGVNETFMLKTYAHRCVVSGRKCILLFMLYMILDLKTLY